MASRSQFTYSATAPTKREQWSNGTQTGDPAAGYVQLDPTTGAVIAGTSRALTVQETADLAAMDATLYPTGYQPPPMLAAMAPFGATETVMYRVPIGANSPTAGAVYEISAFGIITGTSPSIQPRLRLGPLGTTADPQLATTTAAVMTTGTGFDIIGSLTVRATGSAGKALGRLRVIGDGLATAVRVSPQSTDVTVDTTKQLYLTLTGVGGGTSPQITVVTAYTTIIRE